MWATNLSVKRSCGVEQVNEETALSYVRILYGIALCNSFIPASFTVSLAIIMCKHRPSSPDDYDALFGRGSRADTCFPGGSWFTERPEKEVLIDFMQSTEQCSGWPRKRAQKMLIED